MDRLSTVVVIGAGASFELGLPLGSGLKAEIASLFGGAYLQHDEITFEAVRHADLVENGASPKRTYWSAGERIARAMPQAISIDNFVHDQRDDPRIALCSKIAIARCILRAEENSKIFKAAARTKSLDIHRPRGDQHFRFLETEETWLNQFFRNLTQSCTLDELPARFSNITFVIFNYDRCIETFAVIWVSEYHGIPRSQAAEIVGALTFLHPYGHVGPISWNDRKPLPESFGVTPRPDKLYELSKGIRTFTEGVEEGSSQIEEIRNSLIQSKQVLFLGFGYIDLNLRLLGESNRSYFPSRLIGTTQGLSGFDTSVVRSRLQEIFAVPDDQIFLNADTCVKTVQDFSRALQPA
ncbi:hypothetical protein ACOPJQ_05105 [Luteimonas dalianensis]|uniref:hypothetical protein n=1 Tax=Luteimonas dalianensis TaxID=1148196 RepID=UPI003BF3164C